MTGNLRGLVTATHRRHYAVRLDGGETLSCIVRGRGVAIACGDRVEVTRSASNEGTIVAVAARTTLFFRSDIQRDKLLAANVTQVLGFVAPDPPYDDELVHRWIIAAESNGCRFVLIANKQDLPAFALIADRLEQFAALGYPVVPMCAQSGRERHRPVSRGRAQRAHRPVRHGKVDAHQHPASGRRSARRRIVPRAPDRASYDHRDDALRAGR